MIENQIKLFKFLLIYKTIIITLTQNQIVRLMDLIW